MTCLSPTHLLVYPLTHTHSNQWGLLGMDLETGQDRAHLQFYERNLALNALANPVVVLIVWYGYWLWCECEGCMAISCLV